MLDPSLEAMIQPVMKRLREDIDSNNDLNENTMILFRFLYLLTKTRGFKTIGMGTCSIKFSLLTQTSQIHVA